MAKQLPNLIIAGVNKAGTTSLFTYLSVHPEVCPSAVKETCYFLPLRYNKELKPIDHYLAYFDTCSDKKYLLESTPGYFYGGAKLANAIQKNLSAVKLIFMFRNPVDRFLSFYRFKKNHLELPSHMSAETYLEKCKSYSRNDFVDQELNAYFGLEGGKYMDYIKDWEIFSDRQILLADFDQLKKEPGVCMQKIAERLQIDASFYKNYKFQIENKSVSIKNKGFQKIALSVNKNLESFFRKNKKLKDSLRSMYYQLNGLKNTEQANADLLFELETIYTPYNQELLAYLLEKGREDIPEWLKKYNTEETI